jgi:hypothetical protein
MKPYLLLFLSLAMSAGAAQGQTAAEGHCKGKNCLPTRQYCLSGFHPVNFTRVDDGYTYYCEADTKPHKPKHSVRPIKDAPTTGSGHNGWGKVISGWAQCESNCATFDAENSQGNDPCGVDCWAAHSRVPEQDIECVADSVGCWTPKQTKNCPADPAAEGFCATWAAVPVEPQKDSDPCYWAAGPAKLTCLMELVAPTQKTWTCTVEASDTRIVTTCVKAK